MSYRFLPWVRRGLATRLTDPDPLTSDLPARARLPVRVTMSTGDIADVTLRMFGPGDVIGVDPRTIVRVEPARFARNFPPDQMAAIEFDPPDFPWLFTPAAPGAGDQLRPWIVLVVIEMQQGVEIAVSRSRPLPALTIAGPAVPADELPDLAESWAWAHAHVVEEAPPASLPDYLRDRPNLNISRLLCPRRLQPDRDYLACLVPAFESGRLAGLGQEVPETATTTAPAWGARWSNDHAAAVLPLGVPHGIHRRFRGARPEARAAPRPRHGGVPAGGDHHRASRAARHRAGWRRCCEAPRRVAGARSRHGGNARAGNRAVARGARRPHRASGHAGYRRRVS